MEDDQNGRRPKWKTTKMEDDQNGRRPKWKTTKMEDNQNGRMGVRGGGCRRFIQPASSAILRFRDFSSNIWKTKLKKCSNLSVILPGFQVLSRCEERPSPHT